MTRRASGTTARIGRVDAVHVGVDLAGLRPQHRRQGHGRGVAAAAAKRRDVVRLVDPLKTRRNDDVPLVQRLVNPLGRDRTDPGFRVSAVGDDADLRPGQADRLVPQRMDRHRHQRDAHLLAGRKQHVHLAGGRLVGDLFGQVDQQVGVLAHRADDHHHLMALLLGTDGLSRRGEDLLAVGNAGAAKLLDDNGHGNEGLGARG